MRITKSCKHPTCGDVCRRIKKKKKIYVLKRTPLQKISKKRLRKINDAKKLTVKDKMLYAEIWEEREHIDFETGLPIYGEARTLYFHHVLEKHLYPQFRYKKWNIIIISWETHDKVHRNIDLCPKINKLTNFLKKEKC